MKSVRTFLLATAVFAGVVSAARAHAESGIGAINELVTPATVQSTICTQGWASRLHLAGAPAGDVKSELMHAANISELHASDYVVEHVIPVDLGGHPTKRENLRLHQISGNHTDYARDVLSLKLQCMVCSGQMSLEKAQDEIRGDWNSARARYHEVSCARSKGLFVAAGE